MADLALSLTDSVRDTEQYGDLEFGPSGDLVLTSGIDAVRQSLILRLQASVDDYFMAPSEGIPWLDMLGSTEGYTDAFDAILRNTVLGTPGVDGLLSWGLSFDQAARRVSIAFDVQTATGTINFSLPIGENGIS